MAAVLDVAVISLALAAAACDGIEMVRSASAYVVSATASVRSRPVTQASSPLHAV
jgi:hypothetical protein